MEPLEITLTRWRQGLTESQKTAFEKLEAFLVPKVNVCDLPLDQIGPEAQRNCRPFIDEQTTEYVTYVIPQADQ